MEAAICFGIAAFTVIVSVFAIAFQMIRSLRWEVLEQRAKLNRLPKLAASFDDILRLEKDIKGTKDAIGRLQGINDDIEDSKTTRRLQESIKSLATEIRQHAGRFENASKVAGDVLVEVAKQDQRITTLEAQTPQESFRQAWIAAAPGLNDGDQND